MTAETTTSDAGAARDEIAGRLRRRGDFVRAIIADDLQAERHGGRVVTRFPPEPNGYLHIGHAKSIVLNFGLAEEIPGAVCHLRFDDTNPETEEMKYVESIQRDVSWLGYDWGEHLYYASDYFEELYAFAEHLIREGRAYVDSQSEAEIREARGTVTEAGRPSPYRDRPAEESLDLFRRMRGGEFPDGAHVLRAKIDMASANMLMRDPVLYRIRHARHYRAGDEWCIYPLYDWAHPLEDAVECVTHSLCTLEFETNRALYDWVVENAPVDCRPRQYEFARLELDYTVLSKRKLLRLVREEYVDGWDDPRMPTIAGLRRRGITPEAIRRFCEMIGVAKKPSRVDMGKFEYAVRDDLNARAPRVLCVLRPLRVVVTNVPENETEWLDAPYFPADIGKPGSRKLPFTRVLYIERDDFMEEPTEGYRRLAPGRAVRLRHGYVIRCDDVVRDETGEVVELRCSYSPESKDGPAPDDWTVGGAIHWVSAEHALPCEVRLYDRLFRVPDPDAAAAERDGDITDFLNPESLVRLETARVEPSVQEDDADTRYQFERLGYFTRDSIESAGDVLVFNRTVTLRDTWARKETDRTPEGAGAGGAPAPPAAVDASTAGEAASLSPQEQERLRRDAEPDRAPELERRRERYAREYDLSADDTDVLTRERATADFFDAAIAAGAGARAAANWIIHELRSRIADGDTLAELAFDGAAFGRLVAMVESGAVSTRGGRDVLDEMLASGDSPEAIVERRGLRQISDAETLGAIVDEVLAAHPDEAERYRAGESKLVGFFMGRIMAKTRGKADPELARELLRERDDDPERV